MNGARQPRYLSGCFDAKHRFIAQLTSPVSLLSPRRGHGSLRGRSSSAATSGPKHRHCNVHNGLTRMTCRPTATLAICLHPRPGGQLSPAPAQSRECISTGQAQAVAGSADQRNGSPERQMLCRIVQSFLASATRALPIPDRLASASAQSFSPEAFLTRDKITTAASYIRVRASVSPHREILPLRSASPTDTAWVSALCARRPSAIGQSGLGPQPYLRTPAQ